MSSHPVVQPLLSLEEYLALEERSELRHEYLGGHVHAMSGASKRHNRIVGNLYRRLADAAEGGPCRVYIEAVKLRAARDVIYYPDVIVACGPDNGDPLIEDAPCLLVEVISPGTERIDRFEKLLAYRQIPTLLAYLVVEQDARLVERHWREPQGAWQSEVLAGAGKIAVPCPELELSLDEVYARTGVPA